MLKEALNLACTLGTPSIPFTGQPRLVYLLLEIGGNGQAAPLPLNLGLVIDVSESMRIRMVTSEQFAQLANTGPVQEVLTDGVPAYRVSAPSRGLGEDLPRRIDYVAEALDVVSEYLRPVDRFSLVAFASDARLLLPATGGGHKSRLNKAARALDSLELGDGTRLADGLALAVEQLGSKTEGAYADRLILLTDGHTGDVQECYAWVRRAGELGASLTTMGIGSEFNEELLIPLADMTGGNAYYIESHEQIVPVFRKELGSALRVSCTNVQLRLQLPVGVQLKRAHRVLPRLGGVEFIPVNGGGYICRLGGCDPAASQALLLEMTVPGWPAGAYRAAQVSLTWETAQPGLEEHKISQDVVLQVGSGGEAALNEHVLQVARKVGVFRAGLQALEAASQAEGNGAAQPAAEGRLHRLAASLQEIGEETLAQAVIQQAERLHHEGGVNPAATKKLRYETRRLTQNLSS